MDGYGVLSDAQVRGGFLVCESGYYEGQNFALARGEQVIALAQFAQFRSFSPCFPILRDRDVDRPQQFLIVKRFRQELDRAGFHRARLARKRCTDWRIRPSVWRLGSLTT